MNLAVRRRSLWIAREGKPPTRNAACDQCVQPWLKEGDTARSEAFEALFAEVNRQDVMPNLCETCRCDEAYIACAVDNDFHQR
jgi:hypothetical protein